MEFENTTQEHRTVRCERHGDRREAFVCEHLISGTKLGFFRSGDEGNPCPDAWCSACERLRLEHGGSWNDESEALIRVKLVCGDCYEEIKTRNLLGTEENLPTE